MSSNINTPSASIKVLNIHLVFFTPSSVSICFHLLHTARLPPHLSTPPLPENKHTNASHTQKRTGENRAPRKCNISVFNIEVYKIRAEMGSMAICLFIYFIRGWGEICLSMFVFGGPGPPYWSSSYVKNNVVYGYTFIYNGNMGSGLFYNVPYFRLGLTAFYGPPVVHLHV